MKECHIDVNLPQLLYSKETKKTKGRMNELIHSFIHSFIWSHVLRNIHQVLLFWVGSSSFCEHRACKMHLGRLLPKVSAFQLCLGWVLNLGVSHCFLSVTLHINTLDAQVCILQNHLTNVCWGVNFHFFFSFFFLTSKLQFQHIQKFFLL